jgi:hypothetical protein
VESRSRTKKLSNTFKNVLFLGIQRKSYKTLADWISYAKLTAIKVLGNLANNSEYTLMHINNLLDIGVVPRSNYSYGLDDADEVKDERNIAAVEEEMSVIQKTLHLPQSIVWKSQ